MGFTPDGGEMTLDISAKDNASGAIEGIAGSLGAMRGAAIAAGGAMAAVGIGGLAASASAATDFEEAMVEVEKVTGATESQMDDFNDMVMDMSSEIPMAQDKLAGLTADAARFGIDGSENIREFTETAAKMATATTLNATEAGESLAKLGTLTDTPVSEMENLGSAINSLSNNAATSSQEIVDSMLRASGSLSQLGMDQTEIAGLSSAMNEVSESSRRAGSRLRRLGQEMMEPRKVEGLANALGMNAEEFKTLRDENPSEAIRMMAETMGEGGEAADMLRSTLSTTSRQAVSGLSQNLDGLDENLARSNKSFEEGTSLQKEFETEMDTFNAKVQTLKNRLRNVAIEIGTALMPALNAALSAVMPIIDGFATLNQKTDGMAGVAVLAGTAITGLSVAFAALAPVITGTVLPALGAVATVLTGPVGIAIAAIVAAVIGLKYAWDNNIGDIQQIVTKFQKNLQKIFSRIEKILKSSKGPIDFVKNLFTQLLGVGESTMADLERAFENVQATVERVTTKIGQVITFLYKNVLKPTLEAMQSVWDRHFSDMMSEGKETFDAILGYISTAITAVMNVINVTLDIIVGLWNKYGDQIIAVVKPVFNIIKTVVAGAMDTIMTTIRVVMALIRGDWGEAWDLIKGYFSRTVDRIIVILKNFTKYLSAAWDLLITVLKDAWTAAWNFIKQKVVDIFNGIVNYITSIGKQDVYDAFYAVGSAVRGVFKSLVNAIIGAGGFIRGLIGDIVRYIKGGAKRDAKFAFTVLINAVKEAFKAGVKEIIGAGGIIKNMISDIVAYLKNDALGDIKAAAESLWEGIKAAFMGLYDGLIGNSLVKDMIGDIASYLKNTGKDLVKGAFQSIVDAVENVFDTVIEGPSINWPEPPEIIKRAWNGNLNLDWPSPPSGSSSSGGGGSNDDDDDDHSEYEDDPRREDGYIPDEQQPEPDPTPPSNEDLRTCFTGDQPVLTPDGYVEISEIEVDDTVVSYDVENDEITESVVGETLEHDNEEAFENHPLLDVGIVTSDGAFEEIEVTANHLVYHIESDSWQYIGDIPVGHRVKDHGGEAFLARKTVLDREPVVYNLHMKEGPHNYFVKGMLAHNIKARPSMMATGGIVTDAVNAIVGEGSQPEAVLPLSNLQTMLDTSYAAGATGGSASVDVSIRVEGDDELTRLIRENAEVVVEEDNQSKQDRLRRL